MTVSKKSRRLVSLHRAQATGMFFYFRLRIETRANRFFLDSLSDTHQAAFAQQFKKKNKYTIVGGGKFACFQESNNWVFIDRARDAKSISKSREFSLVSAIIRQQQYRHRRENIKAYLIVA